MRYRMGNSPQPGTFGLLLIHNLLEVVIRAMKAEEREGERLRERERVSVQPWKSSPEMGPNVIRK